MVWFRNYFRHESSGGLVRLHLAIRHLGITRFLESRDSASRRNLAMPASQLVPLVTVARVGGCSMVFYGFYMNFCDFLNGFYLISYVSI